MGDQRIYRSTNPDADEWEEVEPAVDKYGDPALFQDNDGRVYLYYGCSDSKPIQGIEVDPEKGFKPVGKEADLIPHNAERLGWEVFEIKMKCTTREDGMKLPASLGKGIIIICSMLLRVPSSLLIVQVSMCPKILWDLINVCREHPFLLNPEGS